MIDKQEQSPEKIDETSGALEQSGKTEVNANEMQEQLLRLAAELENTRKRADRMVEEASKFAISGIAKEVAVVLDNLFRATEAISEVDRAQDAKINSLYEGVVMTQREFLKALEKFHIKRIVPALGEPFDHNLHQAIMQSPTTEYPAGTIAQVIQAGYQLHDRLLRPCLVAVATAIESKE